MSCTVVSRPLGASVLGGLLGIAALTGLPVAQPMQEITFFVVNNLFSTPAFVGVENGYWAQQGLNVKLKLTSSGRQVTQALQAGEAQFGHAAFSTTIASARASGNLLKGVIPYYNAAEYVAKAGGRALVGRKDRGIDAADPKSMEGKRIAHLSGSTNEVYMREWFKKSGADIGKSQLVSVPVAHEDWNKKNHELIEKFSVGIAQAAQFIRKNSGQAAEIDTRYLDGLDLADATEGIKFLQWDPRI